MLTHSVNGGLQEFHVAHTGDLHRVLKRQEDTLAGAVFRFHFLKILAFKGDRAFRHVIARTASKDVAKGALAGSIGAHDGVHLAGLNGEAQSTKDVLAINAGVQVFNLKHVLYLRN